MRWDAWVALVGWCVFAPLYLRAAYRAMLESRREEAARLQGRRRARRDENLTKP